MNKIILGDCLEVFESLPKNFARMIYIDPPFNTGNVQKRGSLQYQDTFNDFESFLLPRIERSFDHLTHDGSLFVHLDYREVHYIKVALDKLLGRNKFMNEIIWAYDYGARQKSKWPTKHDTILWYVMDPDNYVFNYEAMDRIPYMAPALCGAEKAERGKTLTDVYWHTIVPTNGKEKTGYPTQKPVGLLNTFVKVHTHENDVCLDYFAGSGTLGAAALNNNRQYVLIDKNPEAVEVMKKRLC